MSTFRVGDRVRVKHDTLASVDGFEGQHGTVVSVDAGDPHPIFVRMDRRTSLGRKFAFRESELEITIPAPMENA